MIALDFLAFEPKIMYDPGRGRRAEKYEVEEPDQLR